MQIISSWDDGSKEDFRIAGLLKKYKLSGIFFIPNATELTESQIKELSVDFEIGGHTIHHPSDIKLLSIHDQAKEISVNKQWLERIIDKKIDWFCYPRGRYNDDTIKLVKASGFKYARTTLVTHIEPADDSYKTHTTIHVYPERAEYGGRNWLEVAKELFDRAKRIENSVYHVWGHGWECSKYNLWDELEELFKYMKENK